MDPTVNMSAILDSPNIVCECGNKTFAQAFVLKRVSQLISPTGREEIVDFPIYVCSKCGKVPQEFMDKNNAARVFGENKDGSETEPKKSTSGLILNN